MYLSFFIQKASHKMISLGELPSNCGRSLKIDLAQEDGSRLFWKVGDGQSRGGYDGIFTNHINDDVVFKCCRLC